jgi:hypothetical protein
MFKRTIFCVSYLRIHFLRSLISDSVSLDRDSDVPTTSLCKQLRSSAVAVTSDSDTSTEEQENSEPESSDDKTSDMWCKTD